MHYGSLLVFATSSIWIFLSILFIIFLVLVLANSGSTNSNHIVHKNKNDNIPENMKLALKNHDNVINLLIKNELFSSDIPIIKSIKKANYENYEINFEFLDDIGNSYALSLNKFFDGEIVQRSINPIIIKSLVHSSGVPFYSFENEDYDFTFGIYTIEISNNIEHFLLFQAESNYYNFETPTNFRILFEDNVYWDLNSEFSASKDIGPKIHKLLFELNDENFNKVETIKIKKFIIDQFNRNVGYVLRDEDKERIQRMMTTNRIASEVFLNKELKDFN